jgi:hypothetical protein
MTQILEQPIGIGRLYTYIPLIPILGVDYLSIFLYTVYRIKYGFHSPYQEEKAMYKKLFETGYALLSLILLLAFGFMVARAQQGQTQSGQTIFIPIIYNNPTAGHIITGRVVNPQNVPISGVTIRTDQGKTAQTDQNGDYSLNGLNDGIYTLTPSLGGIVFSPASSAVVVPPDVNKLNFTADVVCSEAIINGGFEGNTGWDIPITKHTLEAAQCARVSSPWQITSLVIPLHVRE